MGQVIKFKKSKPIKPKAKVIDEETPLNNLTDDELHELIEDRIRALQAVEPRYPPPDFESTFSKWACAIIIAILLLGFI